MVTCAGPRFALWVPWSVGLCLSACGRSSHTFCVSVCLRTPACASAPMPVCLWALSPHTAFASLPGPVLVSLRPGSELLSPRPLPPERPLSNSLAPASPHLLDQTEMLAAEDRRRPFSLLEEKAPRWTAEHRLEEKKTWLTNGFDIFECPPPKTENEVGMRVRVPALGGRGGRGGCGEGGREMMGEKNNQLCGLASCLLVIHFNSLNKQAASTLCMPWWWVETGESHL